jgi:hypothetical protein
MEEDGREPDQGEESDGKEDYKNYKARSQHCTEDEGEEGGAPEEAVPDEGD